MFKNNNSPVACDIKLTQNLKKEPSTPFNPTVKNNENQKYRFVSPQPYLQNKNRYDNQTTVNYDRDNVGSIGWGVTNPKI